MMRVNEPNYTAIMEITELADGWLISGVTTDRNPERVYDTVSFEATVALNGIGVYGYDRISVNGRAFQGFDSGARSLEAVVRGIAYNAYRYCADGDSFGYIRPTIRSVKR